MSTCLVVEQVVTDPAKLEEYRIKVGPLIAGFGDRYFAKGDTRRQVEGGRRGPEGFVMIELPAMNSLQARYNSADCQTLMALRKQRTGEMAMLHIIVPRPATACLRGNRNSSVWWHDGPVVLEKTRKGDCQ